MNTTRCPFCVAEGEVSKVFIPSGGIRTLMAGPDSWYDEAGQYHYHEVNNLTAVWSCSRDHRWAVTSRPGCPAGDVEAVHEVRRLDV